MKIKKIQRGSDWFFIVVLKKTNKQIKNSTSIKSAITYATITAEKERINEQVRERVAVKKGYLAQSHWQFPVCSNFSQRTSKAYEY